MDAIARGLSYLNSVQQRRGSFRTFSSPSERPFVSQTAYVTTFSQAVMLAALSAVPDESAADIRRRLAGWLLKQRSANWSFNYWPRRSALSKRLPYPDDLDDTFCALTALWLHDPKLIDGSCLGHVVKLLIATESSTGGPYRTWLVPKTSEAVWLDVDVAVNSNVAWFIQQVAGPLPNVVSLIEETIAQKQLISPYYPSIYPLAYYMARTYRGARKEQLAELLLSQSDGGYWGTPLQTALAVSSLIHLGRYEACEAAVNYLHSSQQADGSWPAEAFCIDPAQQGQRFFNGASALTTALAMEALARYNQATGDHQARHKKQTPYQNQTLKTDIFIAVQSELRQLENPLANQSLAVLKKMQERDERGEITLLPTLFKDSLKSPPTWADELRLKELGKANLYGWMAYTLYDDFLDGFRGPELLGVANAAQRRSLLSFEACLPGNAAFGQLVGHTFDRIDNANAWEIRNCRFAVDQESVTIGRLPRYGQRARLAERSLGHTLTPLAILIGSGFELNQPAVQHVRLGLAHYLIARQLSDDLHDWEEDLLRGQVSYVVSELLSVAALPGGTYVLSELIPQLRRQFWHHTVRPLCNTLTLHLEQSRRLLAGSNLLKPKNDLNGLLERLNADAQTTLNEQANAKAFLQTYMNKRY